MGRNGRGFVEAAIAVARTGADLVLLNTGFPAPQLADVVAGENIGIVVHDDEFADPCAACPQITAVDERTIARVVAEGGRSRVPRSLGGGVAS